PCMSSVIPIITAARTLDRSRGQWPLLDLSYPGGLCLGGPDHVQGRLGAQRVSCNLCTSDCEQPALLDQADEREHLFGRRLRQDADSFTVDPDLDRLERRTGPHFVDVVKRCGIRLVSLPGEGPERIHVAVLFRDLERATSRDQHELRV